MNLRNLKKMFLSFLCFVLSAMTKRIKELEQENELLNAKLEIKTNLI